MGLFQIACETYDAMSDNIGVATAEHEPLTPIGHALTQAQIEISLDKDGNIVNIRNIDKNEPKIIIPVTEKSGGRSGKNPTPHPLCDKVKYIAGGKDNGYIDAMQRWHDSPYGHPKLGPILQYAKRGSILQDLADRGIVETDSDGKKQADDLFVCWSVLGIGEDNSGPCWLDRSLMESHIEYINSVRDHSNDELCMISGEIDTPLANNPKGIVPVHGNAKLISANDSQGFTYRGRFTEPWQAATVGYTASQKAHAALRWVIGNQAVYEGNRAFVCWNPRGLPVPRVTGAMSRPNRADVDSAPAVFPSDYKKQLREALASWKTDLPANENVIIAVFDAATTGRLAVTYLNELTASDFLDRLYDWDMTCCWPNGQFGIQAPSLSKLVSWAFGTPMAGTTRAKMDVPPKLRAAQMQRMVACRINRAAFPLDVEQRLVERASNLKLYDFNSKMDLLHVTCSAIRKYHNDRKKWEVWGMALDKTNTNRSYLFGRLLALADAIENSTYGKDDRRETNAMRMQKAFTQHPLTVWGDLSIKLKPYSKRLMQSNPGLYFYFQKTTDEVLSALDPDDPSLNKPLDDVYLLGFSHQRNYRKADDVAATSNDDSVNNMPTEVK